MKNLIILAFIYIFIIQAQTKVYKLDIALSQSNQWLEILNDGSNRQAFLDCLEFMKKIMPLLYTPQYIEYVETEFQKTYFNKEFVTDLQVLSHLLNIPFSDITIYNYVYEYMAQCTSIIIQDENGEIYHGRNLDYGFQKFIIPLSHELQIYENGKYLYTASFVVGTVGFHSGMKPQGFAVSINSRKAYDDEYFRKNFIQILQQQKWNVQYILRKCLQNAQTFQEAVEMLSTVSLDQTVYFIVSGTQKNEGVVIERDKEAVHATYHLSESKWFLVQTNYDREIDDTPLLIFNQTLQDAKLARKRDNRKTPVENKLVEIGQNNIKRELLMNNILSQAPSKHSLTILSIIMSAQTGEFNQFIYTENRQHNSNPYFFFKNEPDKNA